MSIRQDALLLDHLAADPFDTFCNYWRDPNFRKQITDETAANRAQANAAIDRGMAALNEKQRLRWLNEETEA